MSKTPDIYVPLKQESHRQKRVAEEVREILSQIIARGELRVDREHEQSDLEQPKTPVTITHVQVSPDLRNATIFIMPLGGIEQEEWFHYMKHCGGYLRWCLSKKLKLRVVPVLRFKIDDTFEKSRKIDDLIHQVVSSTDKEPESED